MKIKQKLLVVALGTALMTPAAVWAGEVEDLKAGMQKMMERIDQLEAQKGSAGKPAVTSGNKNVRLSLSGQVNRGLLFVDDGEETEVHNVDNDASSTRIRFIGEADASDTLTVGAAIEVQLESNSTADVNQLTTSSGAGTDNFTQRRLEVYFSDKNLGKLWLGQGWTASEGTSEEDLSGTALAGYSDTDLLAGGQIFRNADNTLALTENNGKALNVKSAFTNMDGLGRNDRVRYDTPSFGGFTLATSLTQGEAKDVVVKYKAGYEGVKVAAALAYVDLDSTDVEDQVNGSVSLLLDGGLNATFAAGSQSTADNRDPSFYYTKLGYKMGVHAFSVDYHRSDDTLSGAAAVGDEATSYGAQYVRTIKDWSTEAYVGIRNYELDRTGSDFQDVLGVLAGARVKF